MVTYLPDTLKVTGSSLGTIIEGGETKVDYITGFSNPSSENEVLFKMYFDENQDLTNGEVLTIEYDCSVNIPDKTGEDVVVKNKFTAAPKIDGKREEVSARSERVFTKSYAPSLSKDGGRSSDRTKVDYKIVLNEGGKYDISGETITDTLGGDLMGVASYAGSGITLNGQLIPWSRILSSGGNSWSYKLPSDFGSKEVVITYTVNTDMSNASGGGSLTNKAEFAGKTVWCTKTYEGYTVDKEVTKKDGAYSYYIYFQGNGVVDSAGQTVRDRLSGPMAQYASYNTSIPIEVESKNGQKGQISWNDVTMDADGKGWSLVIPSGYGSSKVTLKYWVTVDDNAQLLSQNTAEALNNTVTIGDKTTGKGVDIDVPEENRITIEKSHDEVADGRNVNWHVSFNVPASGFDSAVLTENLPTIWGSNGILSDALIGDISVSSSDGSPVYYTIEGSKATSALENDNVYVLTFYQDAGHTKTGFAPGAARMINLSLTTELNQQWMKLIETNTWYKDHMNEAVLLINGSITCTAKDVVDTDKEIKYILSISTHLTWEEYPEMRSS